MTTGKVDLVVVGAGFSGLYMLHRARELELSVRVFERGDGVGGTWYWNRYPGARCDIESIDYCYSFDKDLVQEWRWSERYAAQPEILRYLEHVADRFDLRRDITFGTSVDAATWCEEEHAWTVTCDSGETVTATYVVMASGNLSTIKRPSFTGLDDFEGEWYHTGSWPTSPVDLSGKRVAVVGTGSSGIQTVTALADQVEQLYVLQRTPNYSMPAQNHPLSEEEWRRAVDSWDERREVCRDSESGVPVDSPTKRTAEASPEERRQRFEKGWQRGGISALSSGFTDFFTDDEANRIAQDFARDKIREIVRDAEVASLLSPRHHIGTKRTCTDTGYFECFNRDNVELVDLNAHPMQRITAAGIALAGRSLEVDVIVFAIGFDAITGALTEVDLTGVGGVSLEQRWRHGPRTYLGLQSAGFPNLFMVTGPGSPSVLSNMVVSIEQHVDWIADCIAHLRERGLDRIEAEPRAEAQWMEHVADLAADTLYPQATSWYVGANIPGKPRVFMPYVAGCGQYRREAREVVLRDYEGFILDDPSPDAEQEVSA
ncbi:flavin-containing monooxygenase [Nocardioides sp. GXZ039]|uniref:flavin-containing monooxygenase n=1 Tax=Nocardioides sp. GXZ039 TaxID=3136018 RepID=UPI0030F4689D